MKRSVLTVLVSGLILLGAGLPVWAHHSFTAVFDTNQPVTVKGVITQVRLENPHSWFFLDVRDASGKRVDVSFRELVEKTMGKSAPRADLHISRSRDGELFLTSRQDGMIRMLVPDNSGAGTASVKR